MSPLRIALRRVLGRPRLVLGLWLLSLFCAVLGSLPLLLGLQALLETRPAAAPLARGQLDFLFGELLADHPMLLSAAGAGAAAAALLLWLSSVALSGGLMSALRRPGDPRRVVGRQVLVRAAESAGAMLKLSIWGLLLRLPVVLAGAGAALALGKLVRGRGLGATLALAGATVLLLALSWSIVSLVIDYARLDLLGGQDRRRFASLRALRRGLRQARCARGATLLLALTAAVGPLLLTGLGALLTARLQHAGAATALLLLWRQLVAVGRAGLGLTVLAGAVEVVDTQQTRQDSESQPTEVAAF